MKKKQIDIILPTATAAKVIARAKKELRQYCKVAVEDYEKVDIFHDKSKTISIAEKLIIPQPRTLVPKNVDEVGAYAEESEYPVVIKARKGSGANGL